ncbi:MAG: tetratricopeptide repeat protein [Kofleriaceae bacterium]
MNRLVVVVVMLSGSPVFADDPRKQAEAGYAAFQKKDYDTAEKLTRQAIDGAGTDEQVKGAALYNLGQILEAKKDKTGAAKAYKDSLALRKNGIVRDALRALDPAAADDSDTFKPKAMQGPFGTMDDYCKAWLTAPDVHMDAAALKQYLPECAKAIVLKPGKAFKVPAGFEALELLDLYSGDLLVRAKVDGKLYVTPISTYIENGRCGEPKWVFDSATVRGAATELAYHVTGSCADRDGGIAYSERAIAVVGIGPSKKPSVTELRSETLETDDQSHKKTFVQTRTLAWAKDGTSVDVKVTAYTGDSFESSGRRDTDDVRGHHTIAFP